MPSERDDTALIWTSGGAKPKVGSGLLIGAGLVLTARHVVTDDEGTVPLSASVRLLRDGSVVNATVVWKSEAVDLALLRLGRDERPVFTYHYASVTSSETIEFAQVSGFPTATRDLYNRTRDFTVHGSVRRDGPGQLSFSVPLPDTPAMQEQWAGLSGGAVFRRLKGSIREIVGVIEEGRQQFPNGKLYLAPTDREELEGSFQQLIEKAGGTFRHGTIDNSARHRMQQDFPFLSTLYDFSRKEAEGQTSRLRFDIDAMLCGNFEDVKRNVRFPGEATLRVPPHEMLPRAGDDYAPIRVYLQAPGGYGKSSFVKRMIADVIEQGFVAVYLDASSGRQAGGRADWNSIRALFESCARYGGNHYQFERAANDPKVVTLLVIDGLNEAVEDWSKVGQILQQLVGNYASLSILVTDRMNPDRRLPPEYGRATLLPVQPSQIIDERIRNLVESNPANVLLCTPFFLDKLQRVHERGQLDRKEDLGRARIIEDYVATHAPEGKKAEEFRAGLADLAMSAYRDGSRQFSRQLLEKSVAKPEADRLINSGLITGSGNEGYMFVHQLVHDYLVARWLIDKGFAAWLPEHFDPATLKAQSFDALELAAELAARPAEFIIQVYDWNYRAALDCILNLDAGLSGLPSPVPNSLKEAIFALRAEKRFDPFAHTRNSAQDRSAEFRSSIGIEYDKVMSVDELMNLIDKRYLEPDANGVPYSYWRELFISKGQVVVDRWSAIQDSPLLGWTAASAFRRHGALTNELLNYLAGLFRALGRANDTSYYPAVAARWRIVHVLGASDDPAAQCLLEKAVGDEDEADWVRYGAVRSLVEQASRCADADRAEAALGTITTKVGQLPEVVRREVRDVALLAEGGATWWPEIYSKVLRKGAETSKTNEERKAWDQKLKELTGE